LIASDVGRAQQNFVYSIEVDGTIDAGVSNFVRKAIDRAEQDNVLLIIKLNTPGGLLSATQEIVGRMMTSKTTIVVWVTPRGAWGFSAGTFLLMASHVAVMDNATAIGAAQPRPKDPKVTAAMAEWIGSIARDRGRPENIAKLFVTESKTMGPDEAYKNGIIELRASSIEQILDNIGMSGATVEQIDMNILDRVLRVLSNPDVASILFMLGLLGLIFEITTPGIGVPGVAGAICLRLAFWGLGVLQINYVGVALLLLSIALIATEILTPGFGVFGVGGGVALVLGLMMVGVHREPWIEVSGDVLKAVGVTLVLAITAIILLIRRGMKKPPAMGKEGLIGRIGVAVTDIAPRGLVKLEGELWTAVSKRRIKEKERVVVEGVKGITLLVRKHRVRKKK